MRKQSKKKRHLTRPTAVINSAMADQGDCEAKRSAIVSSTGLEPVTYDVRCRYAKLPTTATGRI